MLIESWDNILESLEQKNTAVNLMAIDFEKAFNRMDHGLCLMKLRDMGAKEHTTALVQAFLSGRKMKVKINDTFSPLLPVGGGAPQGCILGPFLFCVSIDGLLRTTPENVRPFEATADLSEEGPPISDQTDSGSEDNRHVSMKNPSYFPRCKTYSHVPVVPKIIFTKTE